MGGGRRGRVHMEAREGGEGGRGVVVCSLGRPTTTPDRRAWVAPLPCKQGRATGVGDAGDGVSVTDGRDRGEARRGPVVAAGVRGRRERARQGIGGALTCWPGRHSADQRGSNQI
jgi:hypothetical protein